MMHPSILSWIDAPVLKYLHVEDGHHEFSDARKMFSLDVVFLYTHLDNLSFTGVNFGRPTCVFWRWYASRRYPPAPCQSDIFFVGDMEWRIEDPGLLPKACSPDGIVIREVLLWARWKRRIGLPLLLCKWSIPGLITTHNFWFFFFPSGFSPLAYPPPGIKRLLDYRSTSRRLCRNCLDQY